MNFLKHLFHFYIQSSIHVALAVFALAMITADLMVLEMPFFAQAYIFCTALVAYNFIKYFDFFKLFKWDFSFFMWGVLVLSLVCFIIGCLSFFYLPPKGQLLAVVAGGIVILYALPYRVKQKNLRNVNGIKIYLVALSWVISTVGIPTSSVVLNDHSAIAWMVLIQFFVVLIATLPFEIRDFSSDNSSLGTWPQRMGVKNSKIAGLLILIVLGLCMYLWCPLAREFIYITWIVFGVLGLLLWKSKEQQSPYYASFWVESIPLLWLFLLSLYFL